MPSELFWQGVEEFIANHAVGDFLSVKPAPKPAQPEEKLSEEEKRLIAAFAKLPKNARAHLLKMLESLAVEEEN